MVATLSDIRTAVRAMTGDSTVVLFLDADIDRYTNFAVHDIARRTRCLQGVVQVTNGVLNGGDLFGGVVLPVDFISEMDVYWGNPPIRLGRLPWTSMTGEALTVAASQPSMYAISDYVSTPSLSRVLYPYPWQPLAATGQYYTIRYVRDHPVLVNGSDPIIFGDMLTEAITFYAARRCKIQEDDWTAAGNLDAEYQRQIKDWFSEQNADHSDLQNFTVRDEITPVYSIWEN